MSRLQNLSSSSEMAQRLEISSMIPSRALAHGMESRTSTGACSNDTTDKVVDLVLPFESSCHAGCKSFFGVDGL